MIKLKLNVLLGKTDHLAKVFKKGIDEYIKFFKNNQGAFSGELKTYEPNAGTIDIPGERGNRLVVTTVREKLDYMEKEAHEYIDALFAMERTNAQGISKAALVVDDVDFGELTSLELLRLKSLLDADNLKMMYEQLPTRSDDSVWTKSDHDLYKERDIYESNLNKSIVKTTMKEAYILHDPNLGKGADPAKYTPMLASRDTIIELGNSTFQKFTGAITHVERAAILARRSKLLTAVITALKVANEVEAVESPLTSKKLFSYLHTGKI